MKAYRGRRVLVYLFVILPLDGGEGVPHAQDALPPGALPDFLSSSGSGTGSTQPREVN